MQPIIAILYDFDNTLSTEDMQDYSFIPSLGLSVPEFWQIANDFGRREHMDGILAYMFTMMHEAERCGRPLTRAQLVETGRDIKLFPGVEGWFSRINDFGSQLGVQVEHYIISSGLREIIEGCSISGEFKEIFASEFYYNEDGVAAWPKLSVNYTSKTQFVYRINKGVLDVSDDKTLNASMPDDSKRVPFTNMIYLGDGLSDVPCMKMMQSYGGQSIAVYKEMGQGVKDLLSGGRVDFIYPADYREGSGLDVTVKNILRKMATADALAEENARQKQMIQRNDELSGQIEIPEY
jgi:2-hydroxy-3-keto-5-methylthiopentenyl-1-phosphate phosphatase